jgi:hypothetical protein
MTVLRLAMAAGLAGATLGSPWAAPASPAAAGTPASTGTPPVVESAGLRDFDFLVGHWTVRHRRLKPGTREWLEFDGTCVNRPLLGGAANLEEHALASPAGAYRAVGLRAFDVKTREWAIWWLDGRYPHGTFDPPVKGRFVNGVGTFVSDYQQDGRPMRVRFVWSRITPTSARWEQATSADSGRTWDVNWTMEFRRAPAAPAASEQDANAPGVHDFDFLRGDWQVRHRYLRGATREWAESEGTCTNGPLMGGVANLEEHAIGLPNGAYGALGFRSYDPKAGRWAIWWLDGRAPHGPLDPPLTGAFENGIGTFFGETTLNDKPARLRFIWSKITPTSARWEQAVSFDAGKTWETVWTMEFRRRAMEPLRQQGLR